MNILDRRHRLQVLSSFADGSCQLRKADSVNVENQIIQRNYLDKRGLIKCHKKNPLLSSKIKQVAIS